ncbi:hypothetical protein J2X69_003297 [Algoriphagus sp. 4150]|nr:hypothetical protein [Algoriphagus sp. 4150]MDR7130938.1 hypothetical protein [Algoriphagus sp. 4150]
MEAIIIRISLSHTLILKINSGKLPKFGFHNDVVALSATEKAVVESGSP